MTLELRLSSEERALERERVVTVLHNNIMIEWKMNVLIFDGWRQCYVFMSPVASTYGYPESMHNMWRSAVDTRDTSAKNIAARYTDRYSDCKTKERALL